MPPASPASIVGFISTMGAHLKLMDNDDYPRYPAQIMAMGELNTLAHTINQCQRHSH
jgi:translation elongation factor P/translation initiation factor 5A